MGWVGYGMVEVEKHSAEASIGRVHARGRHEDCMQATNIRLPEARIELAFVVDFVFLFLAVFFFPFFLLQHFTA